MQIDHFVTIGTAHQDGGGVCEDYSLTGELVPGVVFGAVADGCSGANANTHIGAQRLTLAFRDALLQTIVADKCEFGPEFTEVLKRCFRDYQDTNTVNDYFATIVGFVASEDEAAVYMQGDGVIAVKYTDGGIRIYVCHWWNNTPGYLAYQMQPTLWDQFAGPYEDGVIEPFSVQHISSTGLEHLERFALSQVSDGYVLRFQPKTEGIVALAVMSDGAEQFANCPITTIVRKLLGSVPVHTPGPPHHWDATMQELAKNGSKPRDDVAVAVVCFQEA